MVKNAGKFKTFMEVKDDVYSYEISHNLKDIETKNSKELQSYYDEQLKEYLLEHF